MWYTWTTAKSPRISSMVSWHKANARQPDPNCDTKTSAKETGHGCRPRHMGSCSLRLDGFEADCALRKACPPLNCHSHNRLRQREREERPEAKLTYRQRISLASSVAGIATPASDFPVIPDPDSASVSPPRAQLHSLTRLMDAKD